jgi:predicted deacylase
MARRSIFLALVVAVGVVAQPIRGSDVVSGELPVNGAGGAVAYYELRGSRATEGDGPVYTVVIIAGIHGNERSGPVAALRILDEVDLLRGRLIVVPVANPGAYEAGTRRAPEGEDLNRRFPLHDRSDDASAEAPPLKTWSPTDLLARSLLARVVAWQPDLVIDFHESDRYWNETEGPAVVLPPSGTGSEFVLELLELPELGDFGFTGSPPSGSLVYALDNRGVPAYIVEVPRRYPVDDRVESYRRITAAVLRSLQMVSEGSFR